MLPPLNLPALATTLETDLGTWQGVQGREGAFSLAFSELLTLPSHATGAPAGLSSGRGSSPDSLLVPGQVLPRGGNGLPPHGLPIALGAEAAAPLIPGSPGPADLPPSPEAFELPGDIALPVPVPVVDLLPAPPIFIPAAAGTGPLPEGAAASAAASSMPATLFRNPAIGPSRVAAGEASPAGLSGEKSTGTPAPGLSVPASHPGDGAVVLHELPDPPRLKTEAPATAFDLVFHAGSEAQLPEHKGTLPAGILPAVAPAPASPLPGTSAPQAGTAALVPPPIELAPSDPEWGDALGDRILWMAGHKLQNAELRLNPAELGPVRVHIQVDDGTAAIHFSAQHPLTRDALEQALPRLREMLADQGLTLGNANVTEHGRGQERNGAGGRSMEQPLFAGDAAISVGLEAAGIAAGIRRAAGLVDVFA